MFRHLQLRGGAAALGSEEMDHLLAKSGKLHILIDCIHIFLILTSSSLFYVQVFPRFPEIFRIQRLEDLIGARTRRTNVP